MRGGGGARTRCPLSSFRFPGEAWVGPCSCSLSSDAAERKRKGEHTVAWAGRCRPPRGRPVGALEVPLSRCRGQKMSLVLKQCVCLSVWGEGGDKPSGQCQMSLFSQQEPLAGGPPEQGETAPRPTEEDGPSAESLLPRPAEGPVPERSPTEEGAGPRARRRGPSSRVPFTDMSMARGFSRNSREVSPPGETPLAVGFAQSTA